MPQEDKIKREIDRIGMIIGMIINKLLDKHNLPEECVKDVVQQTKDELNIDLEAFLALEKGGDLNFLVDEKEFSIEQLRSFGNLLYELAYKTNDEPKKNGMLQKPLNIYEYVRANSNGTLFLDVEYRIKELSQK